MAGSQIDELDYLADHALQARLFKISTEQQSLLSKDDAWTISPSNIPKAVLEHVTAHLQRQKVAASTSGNTQEQAEDPPTPARSPSELQEFERFDSQPPEESSADENGDNDRCEAQGLREIPRSSWSTSPLHHMHPPRQMPESHEDNGNQDDDFITQLPDLSPPRPTAMDSSKSLRPTFDFPQSSIGQDDDDELEMEIPTRLEMPSMSLNRAAVPVMATPPSAQIVPCSLEPTERRAEEPARPQSRAGAKQTRYAPVTALYRPARHVEPAPERTESTAKTMLEDEGDDNLSNTFPTDSSSIIPSTHQASSHEDRPPTGGSLLQTAEQPVPSGIGAHSSGPKDQLPPSPIHKPGNAQKAKLISPSPPVVSVPLHPVAKTPNKASVGNPPEETSPFKSFCAAYVTYTGNTRSFVTACIYIQLQHKKIRSSLYDDFIRAWHEGYYAYVRKCDSAVPPVPAAHAYAWYNEMDDDPLYTLRVITKQNLESVLDAYPDEVEDAQRRLGIVSEKKQAPSRQAEELVLVPSVPQETRAPTLPPAEAPILIDEDEDGNDNGEQIAGERTLARAEASPECSMLEGCPVELSPIDFSKSMSEIDLGRQSAKEPVVRSLVRSHSEAGKHKRKASIEIVEKPPKKVPVSTDRTTPMAPLVPAAPLSPSQVTIRPRTSRASLTGSMFSLDHRTPTSTDARRRRFADDPHKRAEHFKKFLLKKRTSGASDSIMSSAPTSAQRYG